MCRVFSRLVTFVTAVIVLSVCTAHVHGDKPRLALVDFDVLNLAPDSPWRRDLVKLVRSDRDLRNTYELIDGDEMRELTAKHGMRVRGSFDFDSCRELAKPEIANADFVVAGTLVRFGYHSVRLDCTVWEAATSTMYKCRDVYFDERSEPDEKAVREVAQSIRAGCTAGDQRIAENTFVEDFTAPVLDENVWQVKEEATESIYPGVRRSDYRVEDGSLRLHAEAQSTRGWSCTQYIWAERDVDLRDQGDHVIDIDLSAQVPDGTVSVKMTPSLTATDVDDAVLAVLFQRYAKRIRPLHLDTVHVRIEISSALKTATVVSDSQTTPEVEGIDLSPLDHWRLRFSTAVGASTGAPRTSATLVVHSVRMARIARAAGIAGAVTDGATQRPVADAAVQIKGLGWTVRTNAAGQFEVACPADERTLAAVAENYEFTSLPSVIGTADAKTEVRLKRVKDFPGDVIATLALAALPWHVRGTQLAGGLAIDDGWMYFNLISNDTRPPHVLCRMSLDGSNAERVASLPLDGGLGVVEGTLYLSTSFPGKIYRFLPDWGLELVMDMDIYGVGEMAYDGKHLWCAANDGSRDLHLLIAVDLQMQAQVRHIDTLDHGITGVASDGTRLWVSSAKGEVYELDKQRIWDNMSLEGGIRTRFPGRYASLEFADGSLWGYDLKRQEICRISLRSE